MLAAATSYYIFISLTPHHDTAEIVSGAGAISEKDGGSEQSP